MKKEMEWNGKNGRRVDLKKWIESERAKNKDFREAYDVARTSTEIARKLAKLRESKGLSQAAIAKMLKTSQAAISRLENPDYQGHSVRMIVRYAKALGQEVAISFHGASR